MTGVCERGYKTKMGGWGGRKTSRNWKSKEERKKTEWRKGMSQRKMKENVWKERMPASTEGGATEHRGLKSFHHWFSLCHACWEGGWAFPASSLCLNGQSASCTQGEKSGFNIWSKKGGRKGNAVTVVLSIGTMYRHEESRPEKSCQEPGWERTSSQVGTRAGSGPLPTGSGMETSTRALGRKPLWLALLLNRMSAAWGSSSHCGQGRDRHSVSEHTWDPGVGATSYS